MQPLDAEPPKEEAVELILERDASEELRYVEANTEAPKNEPDRKDFYSFRSQQSADENPETSEDNFPAVDGDEVSQKIVQGSVDHQQGAAPLESGVFVLPRESAGSENENNRDAQAASSMPLIPLPPAPDFIRQKPEVKDGPGSSLEVSGFSQQIVDKSADTDDPIQLYRPESTERGRQATRGSESNAPEARPLPRKRLRLSPDLLQGPLARSKSSARRRGAIAIDATFSQFGEYEQQFYAAVQAGWYQEIDFFQPIDTSARVVVQFRIKSDGTVDDVTVLDSTAGEIATLICQTALTKRSPFRPWTQEMVQVFGQERIMRVSFSYR